MNTIWYLLSGNSYLMGTLILTQTCCDLKDRQVINRIRAWRKEWTRPHWRPEGKHSRQWYKIRTVKDVCDFQQAEEEQFIINSSSSILKRGFLSHSMEQNNCYPWYLLFTQQVWQPHLLVAVDNNRENKWPLLVHRSLTSKVKARDVDSDATDFV